VSWGYLPVFHHSLDIITNCSCSGFNSGDALLHVVLFAFDGLKSGLHASCDRLGHLRSSSCTGAVRLYDRLGTGGLCLDCSTIRNVTYLKWLKGNRTLVSIRTYSERSQRSTQEPKRDPSGPEGTARTSQATDQRPTVRSQTPALS
jgi:hypothetical protein